MTGDDWQTRAETAETNLALALLQVVAYKKLVAEWGNKLADAESQREMFRRDAARLQDAHQETFHALEKARRLLERSRRPIHAAGHTALERDVAAFLDPTRPAAECICPDDGVNEDCKASERRAAPAQAPSGPHKTHTDDVHGYKCHCECWCIVGPTPAPRCQCCDIYCHVDSPHACCKGRDCPARRGAP